MDAKRWEKIDQLLDAALELSPAQREAFLRENCAGDEDLRQEVLSLLESEQKADDFMEISAMKVLAKELAEEKAVAPDVSLYGREIGTYKIEKLLGAGGMGEVYLAFDNKLNRKVALKILPAEFVADTERIKRFAREARVVSALNHPNIVTIYDVGSVDGINYIATEFVEGRTVRELIGEKIKLREILSIALQAAEALAAAHAANIIHRDIKPENIMVRPDGYVKVLDFGLAKLSEAGENAFYKSFSQTHPGMVMGTLSYMSPEQASGEQLDHRTDIWSLGVVIYEMATGKTPFKGENRQATFNAILSGEPEFPSEINREMPLELDKVLNRALEKEAELRYQTASDFRAELKRLLRQIDSGAVSQSSGAHHFAKKSRRSAAIFGWRIAAVCGLLLVLAAGTGAYFWREHFLPTRVEASPWHNAVAAQITDQPGIETFPSLSPDGKNLVYARYVNGNMDVFWQRLGGTPQNLTAETPADDTHPSFSPDGERIAFRSGRDGGGIFMMGATGEDVKRLTDFGFNPAWSPDGKEIVFSTVGFSDAASRDVLAELWAVNVASGAKRKIETNQDAMQPQFSPDGKRIVFWGINENYQRDLWTISAAGGDLVKLTDDAALDWNPVWSPDGKSVYFCSNRNGGWGIWQVAIDEATSAPQGEPQVILAPLAQSWLMTLSRDGKNLVYVRRQILENIQRVGFDPVKKQIVGKPEAVTAGTRRSRAADVSPDGESITFYVVNGSQEDIYISRLDGSKQVQLTNSLSRKRVPRFSHDGEQIAFYSDESGNYEIWTINADGSNFRQLTSQGGRGLRYPLWSPDGRWLAYSTMEGGANLTAPDRAWAQQTPRSLPPLNEQGDWFVGWKWSPDAKKIAGWRGNAVEGENPGVYVYDLANNSYEKVSDTAMRPAWLADNRHLLASQNRKLYLIDSQTKTERELLSLMPQFVGSPAVTPDNRYIFYTIETIESDIQMLSLK